MTRVLIVFCFVFQIYYDPSKDYMVSSEDFDDNVMEVDTPDNRTSFTITGLIPNTNYTVNLSAFTGAGRGDFSINIRSLTPSDSKYI